MYLKEYNCGKCGSKNFGLTDGNQRPQNTLYCLDCSTIVKTVAGRELEMLREKKDKEGSYVEID